MGASDLTLSLYSISVCVCAGKSTKAMRKQLGRVHLVFCFITFLIFHASFSKSGNVQNLGTFQHYLMKTMGDFDFDVRAWGLNVAAGMLQRQTQLSFLNDSRETCTVKSLGVSLCC